MPVTLTDVDAFDASVVVPAGGDLRNAASVAGPFQSLANRTRNTKNRFEALRNRLPGECVAPGGFEIEVPILDPLTVTGSGAWIRHTAIASSDEFGYLLQSDTSAAKAMRFRVPLPRFNGYTITGIRALITGQGGLSDHAAVPATRPTVALHSIPANAISGGTIHATARETYGSVAAYNSAHNITTLISGALPITPSVSNNYFLVFTGETGANAEDNKLTLMGLYVTLLGAT